MSVFSSGNQSCYLITLNILQLFPRLLFSCQSQLLARINTVFTQYTWSANLFLLPPFFPCLCRLGGALQFRCLSLTRICVQNLHTRRLSMQFLLTFLGFGGVPVPCTAKRNPQNKFGLRNAAGAGNRSECRTQEEHTIWINDTNEHGGDVLICADCGRQKHKSHMFFKDCWSLYEECCSSGGHGYVVTTGNRFPPVWWIVLGRAGVVPGCSAVILPWWKTTR